jgi:hypothetical protein
MGGGSANVADGRLTLQSQGFLLYDHAAKFDSLTAKAAVSFKDNGLLQGVGMDAARGALFVVSGFMTGQDGYLKGSSLENAQMQKTRKSQLKAGARINTELVWKGGHAGFKANSAVWPELTLGAQPEGVSFRLCVMNATDSYEEIILKGRLNKAWLDAALGAKSQPQAP